MNIVDAHHHIWLHERLPWLQGPPAPRIFGPYEPLRRDYLVDDYRADAEACGVHRSVFVQANVAPRAEIEEAAWVAAAAMNPGPVGAIVAFADLASADLPERLDALAAIPGVRGIRQQLHWHEDPAYRYAARPDAMLDSTWQRGLAEATRRGLLFELQVFPSQFADALALVDRFEQTRFVLLHAGMPADPSAEARAFWRAGLERFAARPHVEVKLSGLGTFERACRQAAWEPVIAATVDAFGPARCMFGSNFPVEKLWTSYAELLAVFKQCIARYTPEEQAWILGRTATRAYALADADAPSSAQAPSSLHASPGATPCS